MENINFTKKVFEKTQYKKVIPTQFTQLRVETPSAIVTASLPSINQFFDFYNQLFYEIPQTGDVNSHEYLINQSSTYVGVSQSRSMGVDLYYIKLFLHWILIFVCLLFPC